MADYVKFVACLLSGHFATDSLDAEQTVSSLAAQHQSERYTDQLQRQCKTQFE